MHADQVTSDVPNATAGLIPSREEMAKQLGKGQRTIIRYERAGMPVIVVGMLRLYDPQRVRAWLLTHERNHDKPQRGRPAKRIA